MSWHLDTEMSEHYATGRVTAVLAASVEQHVLNCADCRALLPSDPARLDAVWAEVRERVHAPRPSLLERVLRRLGTSEATARVIASTPSLRSAWLTAVVVLMGLSLWTAHASPRGVLVFTTLAPVLPLLGVAGSFGPGLDPTHEVAAASPYSMMRLLVARATFVVGTTLVPLTVAGLLLPGDPWAAVTWLLPSLALATVSLAAARFVPLHLAALGLSGFWVALCVSRAIGESGNAAVESGPTIQLASLLVLALAGWSIGTHRQDLSEQLRRHL